MDYSPFYITKKLYHNTLRVMMNALKTIKKKYAFTYHTHELWDSLPQDVKKV